MERVGCVYVSTQGPESAACQDRRECVCCAASFFWDLKIGKVKVQSLWNPKEWVSCPPHGAFPMSSAPPTSWKQDSPFHLSHKVIQCQEWFLVTPTSPWGHINTLSKKASIWNSEASGDSNKTLWWCGLWSLIFKIWHTYNKRCCGKIIGETSTPLFIALDGTKVISEHNRKGTSLWNKCGPFFSKVVNPLSV